MCKKLHKFLTCSVGIVMFTLEGLFFYNLRTYRSLEKCVKGLFLIEVFSPQYLIKRLSFLFHLKAALLSL